MKYAISMVIAVLMLPASAYACQPLFFPDDRDRMKNALRMLGPSVAAIDGVVISGAQDVGSVATIRPTKVWFGPKKSSYRIVIETMCSDPFQEGDHVRVLLFEEGPPWDAIERLKRKLFFWRWHAYEADQSEFSWAMRYKTMRLAVEKKAKSRVGQ